MSESKTRRVDCLICGKLLSTGPWSTFFVQGRPKRTRLHIWCFEEHKIWDPERLTNVGIMPKTPAIEAPCAAQK